MGRTMSTVVYSTKAEVAYNAWALGSLTYCNTKILYQHCIRDISDVLGITFGVLSLWSFYSNCG